MSQSAPASDGDDFDFALYRYTPSLVAAIIAVVVFALLTAGHLWRLIRSRTYYFVAFTVGGLFETVGYCGRIWSHYETELIGGYVTQAILILVAPALFAASIYMILGRLIRSIHADSLSIIPLRWMTTAFVIADVVSFTMQAAGGGIQAGGSLELYNLGERVIVAGLFVQIAFFGFFVVTASVFHIRATSHHTIIAPTSIPWQRHLWILYTACTLILVRSIFRVVEYLQGNSGFLISHEIFLYFFDMLLMALTMIVLLVWHVGDLAPVQKPQSLRERSDNSEEVMMLRTV